MTTQFFTTSTDVYNALIGLVTNLTFPAAYYDPSTHLETLGAHEPIASLELAEVEANFYPSRMHRDDVLDRTTWEWNLILTFHKRVDLTALFSLFQGVPRMDGTRMLAKRFRITHPPRQNPDTGTRVDIELNVLLRPL